MSDRPLLHCSFCAKSQNEVRALIAGPTVFICDECVDICTKICAEKRQDEREERALEEIRKYGT